MGTGTSKKIEITIKGTWIYDYEDKVDHYDIFIKGLEILCAENGLKLEHKEIY